MRIFQVNLGKISIGLAVIFLLSCVSLKAEESLTWEECLERAAAKNADIAAGSHSVEKAKANYDGAYSGFYPTLSGTASYNRTSSGLAIVGGAGAIPSVGSAIVNGPQGSSGNQYAAGLTVSQNIFNGFQDKANVAVGEASLESARYSASATEAQVRYDLRNAFARVLYYNELLALDQDIVNRRKENADLVELRFEGGNENKGNYLRSTASYHMALVDAAQIKRDLAVSQENLGRLLGKPPGYAVSAIGNLDLPVVPSQNIDFNVALSRNPSHQQAQSDLKTAESGIKKSQSGYFPTLAANGSVFRQDTNFPPQNTMWSAGLTLTVPIFSGLSTYYSVQNSVAERDRAEANLTKIDQQAMVSLKQAYADFLSAIEHAQAQDETAQAAKIRSQVAKGKYQIGLQSFEDWDLIENDLITQQQQLLSQRLQAISALAAWEQALGMGVSREK